MKYLFSAITTCGILALNWCASSSFPLRSASTSVLPNVFSKSGRPSRDEYVQEVLELARKIGPIGADASEEDQKGLLDLCRDLEQYSDPNPSRQPLRGVHNLVYSAAKGGSSGKLVGPISGRVTQNFFRDGVTFVNAVQIGPIEISLEATKEIKTQKINTVRFRLSRVKLFGQTIVEKEIGGGGTWKYLFIGNIVDRDGKEKLVRVMETPSLFVIEQPVL